MRVDLRRCDRCHGEYDANQVPEAWDIKRPTMQPVDLCRHCTAILAGFIDELPEPSSDLGDGVHLGTMATEGYVSHQTERVLHEFDRGIRAVNERVDQHAAAPLIIP